MNVSPSGQPRPLRAAASLILARDGAQGLEVLMLKRGDAGDFPGLHVFPGGLVDSADSDPRLIKASQRDADSARVLLQHDEALPSFIAAVRESLEEIGVLLGQATATNQYAAWQQLILARERSFADLVADEALSLATDALGYFSHWITPVGIPRRYDTRFFVARMPAAQTVSIDGREAVAADWLSPQAALAANDRGDIRLIFPTIRNLQALAVFATVDALLAHTQQPRPVPAMQPKMVNSAHGMRLLLPGDAGYDEA